MSRRRIPLRPGFDFLIIPLIGLLPVTLVGLDPVVVLTPLIFGVGVVLGVVRLRRLHFSTLVKTSVVALLAFSLPSLFHDPVWNWVIRVVAGAQFFYLVNLYVDSHVRMRRVLFAAILGMLISTAIALGSLVGLYDLEPRFFPVVQSARFGGLYGVTVLAIYTALLLFWVIDELYQPKLWKGGVAFKLLVIVVLAAQLLATLTRSAWLGMAVGISLYLGFVLYSTRLLRKLALLGTATTIAIGVSFFIATSDVTSHIRSRIFDDSLQASDGEQKRASFFFTRNALEVAAENPWGVGLGNTPKYTENFNGFEVGAHNTFVMVLSDLGWGTFTAFTLLQLAILSRLFVLALKAQQVFGVSARMVFCSYVSLVVAAMFQDLLYYMPMWLIPAIATVVVFARPKPLVRFPRSERTGISSRDTQVTELQGRR